MMKKTKNVWIGYAAGLVAVREYAKLTHQSQVNRLPWIVSH